jgi:TRAP-type C4-dicarboxylate transport system permease small subunit
MDRLRSVLHGVAIMAGYAFFALSIFIVVEILARKLFNYSFQGADEIGGYVLAAGTAGGFGFALIHRSHTRIDLLVSRLSGRRQAAFNLLAYVSLAAFATFMAWRGCATLQQSIEFGSLASTPLQTPLWIPQSLWAGGLVLFAVAALIMAGRATAAFFRDVDALNREFGPITIREEVEEQVHDLTSAGRDI